MRQLGSMLYNYALYLKFRKNRKLNILEFFLNLMNIYETFQQGVKRSLGYFAKHFPQIRALTSFLPDDFIERDERKIKKISNYEQGIILERARASYLENELLCAQENTSELTQELEKTDNELSELKIQIKETEFEKRALESQLVLQCYASSLIYTALQEGYRAELESRIEVQKKAAGHLKLEIRELEAAVLKQIAMNYRATHPRDFMIAVGRDDLILDISDRALKRLGCASQEVIGKNIYSFFEDPKQSPQQIRERLRKTIASSLRDSSEKAVSEVLSGLLVVNSNNEKYKINAVIAFQFRRGDYLGAVIVEESWRENRARKREDKKAAREKRKSKQAEIKKQSETSQEVVKAALCELESLLDAETSINEQKIEPTTGINYQ